MNLATVGRQLNFDLLIFRRNPAATFFLSLIHI